MGYSNQAFHKLFGWSLDDIVTLENWFLIAYPDDNYRAEIISNWEALMEKTHELNLVTSPHPMEVHVTCKDGSVKICNIWYQSTFSYMFGIFYDITEQRNAENQLLEKNIELQKLSQTDGLTGLLNRASIENGIGKEIHRVKRYDQDLFSIIMLDLDHFKLVNDTYGHAQGDLVLKTVSKLIEDNKRISDQAGRWGGEEFMILCPNADLKAASNYAEKLRNAIEAQYFELSVTITASFGVATYTTSETVDDLCSRVDERLYKAKESGRNCVVG